MRAKEFIIEAIPLDQLRSAGSPETQANKDLSARLKQGMSSKPRNFVSKNAKMGGAGAHKDKKRAEKQGDVKHKAKQYEQGVAEDWKSKVAGAALAGAAALGGGGAQASEPVTPLAVMATIKMKLPDGSIKTIKKDLGHSYDYRLDDARKDLENVLDRKGIKNYTIHLDRYNAGDADSTAPEKTKDYMDKTPSIGKADDNKNYMDKGPYTSKPSKTTYLDKSTGKEFRDMNNY